MISVGTKVVAAWVFTATLSKNHSLENNKIIMHEMEQKLGEMERMMITKVGLLHGGRGDKTFVKIPNGATKYEAVFVRQKGKPVDGDWGMVEIERGFCTYNYVWVLNHLKDQGEAKKIKDGADVYAKAHGIDFERALSCFVVDVDDVKYQASQFIWAHSDKCCGACQWDTTSGV